MDNTKDSLNERGDPLHKFAEDFRQNLRNTGMAEETIGQLDDEFVKRLFMAIPQAAREAALMEFVIKAILVSMASISVLLYLLPYLVLIWTIALCGTIPFFAPEILRLITEFDKIANLDVPKIASWGDRAIASSLRHHIEVSDEKYYGQKTFGFIIQAIALCFYSPAYLLEYGLIVRMGARNYHRWPLRGSDKTKLA